MPLKRQPAYHIDKIRATALMPDMTQPRTCGIKLNEAEELLIEAAREGMSQPMQFGETLSKEEGEAGWLMSLTKLRKTDLENTTAAFRDKLKKLAWSKIPQCLCNVK